MYQEDKEKELFDKRIQDTNKAILDRIAQVERKSRSEVNLDDKWFIFSRQDYLTDEQKAKFEWIIKAKLPRPDGQEDEEEIVVLTRKELESAARRLGIEDPEDKKLYRTNEDLVKVIENTKEERRKAQE